MFGFLDKLFFKKPRFRRFVTRVLERNRNLSITIMGFNIWINSRKEQGYLMASRLQQFSALLRDEAPVLMTLGYIVRTADAFVDIGANVGVYTSAVSKFNRLRKFRQYAFEANPDTFLRLTETNRDVGAELFNYALSDAAGELEFIAGAVSHVFTTKNNFSPWSIEGKAVKIPARRLDSFKITGSSIVMKIDVEGQELAVLRGAEELFAQGRVIACYVDGYADEGVPRFLAERGFVFYDGRTLLQVADGKCFALLALKKGGEIFDSTET